MPTGIFATGAVPREAAMGAVQRVQPESPGPDSALKSRPDRVAGVATRGSQAGLGAPHNKGRREQAVGALAVVAARKRPPALLRL